MKDTHMQSLSETGRDIVFDAFPDPAVIVDLEREVISANKAFIELFGYRLAELKGQKTNLFYARDEDYESFDIEVTSPILPSENLYLLEFKTKSGRCFKSQTTILKLTGDDGAEIGYLGIIRDNTPRSRLLSCLHELACISSRHELSEDDKINHVLDLVSREYRLETVCLSLFSAKSNELEHSYINQEGFREDLAEHHAALSELLYSVKSQQDVVCIEDFANSQWSILFPSLCPLIGSALLAPLDSGMIEGEPGEAGVLFLYDRAKREEKFHSKDMVTIEVLAHWCSMELHRIAQDHAVEILNEKKRNDLERFSKLYRETPAMMHSISSTGAIIEVSNHWLDMMGYSRDEVLGRPSTDFLTEKSVAYAKDVVLPEFWKNGFCHDVPYEFQRKNGTIIEVLLSAVKNESAGSMPDHSLAVIIDVTAKNKAERALAERHAKLEQTNRDLEEFAYVAAHDIQEPLQKIESSIKMLERLHAEELSPDALELFNIATQSTLRMRQLVSDVLRVARAGTVELELQETALQIPLNEAVANLDEQISEANAEISCDPLPTLNVSKPLMRQLFQNLIGNALKYRSEQPCKINITCSEEPEGYKFSILDNGIGIDAEHSAKIFNLFQRLHGRSKYKGTGMGLALCRRIIERHEGTISLDATYGFGAKFDFYLPRNMTIKFDKLTKNTQNETGSVSAKQNQEKLYG